MFLWPLLSADGCDCRFWLADISLAGMSATEPQGDMAQLPAPKILSGGVASVCGGGFGGGGGGVAFHPNAL